MEYEIVTLQEKIAVGIAARTNNLSPDMGAVIGGQVLTREPDEEKFRGIAQELGIDSEDYIRALHKVPIRTDKAIRAAAGLLEG